MSLRKHVVLAVYKRNFLSYFSGVSGYLFIVVFVALGSLLAFSSMFFANNLATLDQLNKYFPLLLLFIIPAVTMSIWADERKAGTDELLFTLPASDGEIVLGKYLSVLAVYTVALLFSLSHVLVLIYLGSPDVGLIFANYLGYWVAGAALLTAGMAASMLTSSTTVAFVVGAILCAVPVFIDTLAPHNRLLQGLGITEQLRDFALGMIPVGGLLYFISLAVLMLYLNLVLVSKRHWSSGAQGTRMGLQFVLRAASLIVTLISVNVVFANWNSRWDVTSEGLFSVTQTTKDILKGLKSDRRILVQAFISPEVPREFVPVQTTLVGLLRQYDQLGGKQVQVRIVETRQYSEQAEEAKRFGIESRQIQTERGGKTVSNAVFLGIVVTGGGDDEVVIPFFDVGTPVEYELTRSIRTVSEPKRLKVGVLTTDAKLAGGFNMQTFSSDPQWRIVTELKKQYDVQQISPDMPISGDFDVLIAALPSSLTDPQLNNLIEHVKQGRATLILDDPLPAFNLGIAPRMPKPRQGGGMFGGGQQPPTPKGNVDRLTEALGIIWDKGQTVWDIFNPHPQFSEVIQPDLVFVGKKEGAQESQGFNQHDAATSGLQEVLVLFPGTIQPRAGSSVKFSPLMQTNPDSSGTLRWEEITQPAIFGQLSINPNPRRRLGGAAHCIAARITGTGKTGEEQPLNAIFVADLDLISDTFFAIRDRQMYGLNLDNVTFVLNAVDVLAGDESFLALRKRRTKHRTLTTVERQTEKFLQARAGEAEQANQDAQIELNKAKARLDKILAEIDSDTTLDPRTKDIRKQMARQTQQRRLDVEEAHIENRKRKRIQESKVQTEREIRRIEQRIWLWAIIIPPFPATLLGIFVLTKRITEERRGIVQDRLVRAAQK